VFFIPEGDEHAYHGLGYDARGDYVQAAKHYREFLTLQPDGRYSDIVKSRLKEIRGKANTAEPRRRKLQIEPERWSF